MTKGHRKTGITAKDYEHLGSDLLIQTFQGRMTRFFKEIYYQVFGRPT